MLIVAVLPHLNLLFMREWDELAFNVEFVVEDADVVSSAQND